MKKASNELSDDILTQIFFTHTQQKKGEDEYYRKLHQENFDYGNAGGYIQEDLMEIIMLDEDEQDGGDHKGHPILIVDMWLDECEGFSCITGERMAIRNCPSVKSSLSIRQH